ncbi:MAG: MmgE/PrpD family protein [Hyphomicrobiaceae bacterium]|nr:MAG: MmgE/PrpD family protein [Hyphomicrobiaceae bacterium]
MPAVSVSQRLASAIVALGRSRVPPDVRESCERLLLDFAGLCLAARETGYVTAARAAWPSPGPATILGAAGGFDAAAAAFVNGTAAHGEDFDDTFEGGPVHAGAVILPAVLALCEQEELDGKAALLGIAVGCETLCRLSLVAPKAVHKAGFHPTSVFGAVAAAAGAAAALGLGKERLVDAIGIAGSMASGVIEYLAEGAWTKRMHPGWAAQSGLRAALLARAGFTGPRTLLEGVHGLFNGFARTTTGEWSALVDGFGTNWMMTRLAFKPYPCGTMIQPYIDCALRLRERGLRAEDIAGIEAEAAEGIVHRLWEPLAAKQRPANGYAAKFSTPYCIATALVCGEVDLKHFSDEAVRDEAVLALAARISYRIDPTNPYPGRFTGHVRVNTRDGKVLEDRQPDLRGGHELPLSRDELERKFMANAQRGRWPTERARSALAALATYFDGPSSMVGWRE